MNSKSGSLAGIILAILLILMAAKNPEATNDFFIMLFDGIENIINAIIGVFGDKIQPIINQPIFSRATQTPAPPPVSEGPITCSTKLVSLYPHNQWINVSCPGGMDVMDQHGGTQPHYHLDKNTPIVITGDCLCREEKAWCPIQWNNDHGGSNEGWAICSEMTTADNYETYLSTP